MKKADVASITEIAKALGVHRTSAVRRAADESWPYTEQTGRGGRKRLYPLATLPDAVRLAVVGQAPVERLLPDVATRGRAVPLRRRPIGPLSEKQRRLSSARFELVRLYMTHLAQAGHGGRMRAREEFLVLYEAPAWPALRELLGPLCWQTIERWQRILQEEGDPQALADTRGGWRRGNSRLSPEQMQILATFAYHPNNMRLSHCVRWAQTVMRKHGIDTMSVDTYRRYIERLRDTDYPAWVFYREGEQQLENKCGYTLERDWSRVEVGDLVTADGHVLNFEVINPWTGKPCRPILVLFFDCRSNMPLGWELMPTENTASIHVALRRSILALGKYPKVVYLDNGRAFKGQHFTNSRAFDDGTITGLYARLGIATTFATPYHGQAKTVERFFGTLLEMESVLPTYTGSDIGHKPARMHRGERLHRALWDRYGGGSVALSLQQAHEILACWFDDYANRPQRGHLDGQTPIEVFNAGRGPGVDEAELVELMLSIELRTIRKEGISLMGRTYYHPALYGRREPVVVRYDLQDRAAIWVYEKDGGLLCRAEPKCGVHPAARTLGTETDREQLAAELATKNRMKTLTVGPARKLLKEQILPEHERHMQAIGMGPEQVETVKGTDLKPVPKKITHIDMAKARREADEAVALQAEAERSDLQGELLRLSEPDRYERLIELEAQGQALGEEWLGFMAYFESLEAYAREAEYWEACRVKYGLMYRASARG